MTRTAIPVLIPTVNGASPVNLNNVGVEVVAGGAGYLLQNPVGRSMLFCILGSRSQGTLTVDTIPTATDTMTIGNKVFTFRATADFDVNGEVQIVAGNLAACQAAIVNAINGTDGVNTAHTQVTAAAFGGNACVITAIEPGAGGNTIATTETFTAGTNIFNAVTLGTTRSGAIASAVTITIKAVPDPDGRGGSPTNDVVFVLATTTVAPVRAECLNRFMPALFNQSGSEIRQIEIDASGLTGAGKLVAISM